MGHLHPNDFVVPEVLATESMCVGAWEPEIICSDSTRMGLVVRLLAKWQT
jgi:hypothetical protein